MRLSVGSPYDTLQRVDGGVDLQDLLVHLGPPWRCTCDGVHVVATLGKEA